MRTTYRVLAYLIAFLVAVQAAALAFAVFGLGKWIEGGGVMDKTTFDSSTRKFSEELGFMIHGMSGEMLIPLVAIVLLIISFVAKIPQGQAWAGAVLGLIALQVALGFLGHDLPFLGLLHGANAILLLGVALFAGWRVNAATRTADIAAEQPDRVVV